MKEVTIYLQDFPWGGEWVSDKPFASKPLEGERRFKIKVLLPDHPFEGEEISAEADRIEAGEDGE